MRPAEMEHIFRISVRSCIQRYTCQLKVLWSSSILPLSAQAASPSVSSLNNEVQRYKRYVDVCAGSKGSNLKSSRISESEDGMTALFHFYGAQCSGKRTATSAHHELRLSPLAIFPHRTGNLRDFLSSRVVGR